MDRLDRSQVEIKASRDTRTGFITLDPSCKKNPKRPQIEASRRKVQEMQRIRVFGNDRERGPLRSSAENVLIVQNALEDTGIAFIDEDNELGPGVRFTRQEKRIRANSVSGPRGS